jgi:hypothetical protein
MLVHVLIPQYFAELIGGIAAAADVYVQLLFWLTVNSSLAASAHFEAHRRGYSRAASSAGNGTPRSSPDSL